jgi:hypothetical protein
MMILFQLVSAFAGRSRALSPATAREGEGGGGHLRNGPPSPAWVGIVLQV